MKSRMPAVTEEIARMHIRSKSRKKLIPPPFAQRSVRGTRSKAYSFQLDIDELIDNKKFRADFRSFLKKHDHVQNMYFFDALKVFRSISRTKPKRARGSAKKLFEKFLITKSKWCLQIAEHHAPGLKKKLNSSKFVVDETFFTDIEKGVRSYLETKMYTMFLKSPEYLQMLSVQQIASGDDDSLMFKMKGWKNEQGFISLQVDLKDAEGLPDDADQVHCVLAVDSRAYKSKSGSCKEGKVTWYDHFEFPVRGTTQQMHVLMWGKSSSGSRMFLGRIILPMDKIKEPYKPLFYTLLPRAREEKVSGELQLCVSFSKDEAKDSAHEVVQYDSSAVTGSKDSKMKNRFKEDGFNLDLTYVTDHIIAMGYPSLKPDSIPYRNRMESVEKFFNMRHPKSYKLYNLCVEQVYDGAKFKGRVSQYPFKEDNACEFEMIKSFCKDVYDWLDEHPQNVAAVHCKAGKGRTGMMIACYMLYANMQPDAESALEYFAKKRTQNEKGVTNPSQIRYVHYFSDYCKRKRRGKHAPPQKSMFVQSIRLTPIPSFVRKQSDIRFVIRNNHQVYSSSGSTTLKIIRGEDSVVFDIGNKLLHIAGDVVIRFYNRSSVQLFQCWVNTRFLVDGADLTFDKTELDQACKDTNHTVFPEFFEMEVRFGPLRDAQEDAFVPEPEEHVTVVLSHLTQSRPQIKHRRKNTGNRKRPRRKRHFRGFSGDKKT